jgi:integrase
MPSVFKLHLTRYVDASGRRVPANAPGARKVRERSRKWYGEYTDADAVLQRVPLAADKAAAQTMLNELVRKAERRASGLFDPFEEHAKRPLAAHLEDYQAYMQSKNNSAHHVGQTIRRIQTLADACGIEQLADIDGPKIATWLSKQRTTKKRFSAQTSNFYLDGFKYFCNWLVTHERMPRNPLASLERVSVETDRRHDRRSIGDEEFERLLRAAEQGPSVQGISGPDRVMLYLLATWTGFRRRELSSLTLRSFQLDAEPPLLRVKAAYTKRRREDTVPLHP